MATRNLTEPFVLMRNNALQTRHIYAEQNMSDRMALVAPDGSSSDGVELKGMNGASTAPPVWIDALEEAQYILSRLRAKVDSLIELHAKQLTRPTLDDNSQEERQMDQLTREIGRAFSNGYRQVQIIKSAGRHEKKKDERQLALSAVTAISSALQDLAMKYRLAQNNYVQKIKSREERNRPFFTEDDSFLVNGSSTDFWSNELMYENSSGGDSWQQNQQQDSVLLDLVQTEESVRIAMETEKEVGQIVQSISELNHIFKDLANMVHDQGTVMDRIDYNIEQTQVQVYEGYKQLKKAESYKRASRKLYCIVALVGAIILLFFLFIVFKT